MVMWFDWVNVNSGLQLIYEIQYTHDSGLKSLPCSTIVSMQKLRGVGKTISNRMGIGSDHVRKRYSHYDYMIFLLMLPRRHLPFKFLR